MGMFDWYVPNPVLSCPKCASALADWQGKGGPCDLFEWVQGHAEPRTQRGEQEFALAGEPYEAVRLPQQFAIYTSCHDCGHWVDATCFCEDETWAFTDLYLDTEHHGLPEGWRPVTVDSRESVATELERELCSGHILYGLSVVPMARRDGRDEVLFRVYGAPAPLYLVHLTWRAESTVKRPVAVPYRDYVAFRNAIVE